MTQEELKAATTLEVGEDSTVTITGELPFSELEKHRERSVKYLGKDMNVDGFRQGHVPEKVVVERIGEPALLADMAERALADAYPNIIKAHNVDAIGYPQVNITKLAAGNPLGFSAKVAVLPEITLPAYKEIAAEVNKNKESAEVTDDDVEAQIKDILRQKVAYERLQQKAEPKDGETELPTPETVEKPEDLPLPELTDELVQTLGQPGQFTDVTDFRSKIREHLEVQKKQEAVSKHRAAITDAIIEKTEMKLPEVMIDAEMNQMFAQMEEDLKRAQLSMDDYLQHMKKTRDDLRDEWKPAAEKRAKLQLVLNEIAKKENITPDEERVENETKHLLEHYKDANESQVRTYIASMLANEAVMEMLEQI